MSASAASTRSENTGLINPKYESSPRRTFYTHFSDQYAPFSAKVVNVGVRDSTYVLDGCFTMNLTGDYLWRRSTKVGGGEFRPMRPLQPA